MDRISGTSLSKCLWNQCPSGRGMSVQVSVDWVSKCAWNPHDWLSSHPFQYTNTGLKYDPEISDVTIGHDAWIGHSAMILEGVTVGTGAIIATRSVVAHDVPPYAVVAGVPAKVVKYRHTPELISELLNSKWWDCDIDSLRDLPLNDPRAVLPMLGELRKEKPAQYREIQVTRKGCCVLT